jgi:hypothetical protein
MYVSWTVPGAGRWWSRWTPPRSRRCSAAHAASRETGAAVAAPPANNTQPHDDFFVFNHRVACSVRLYRQKARIFVGQNGLPQLANRANFSSKVNATERNCCWSSA